MEDGFTLAHIDPASRDRLIPIRRELGVSTFGVNLIALEPRQRLRIHRHHTQEEAYIVLEGTLTLVIEGEEHVLGPFDAIRVAPALRRQLTNRGTERVLVMALGGSAEHLGRDGEAFASWDDVEGRPPPELPLPEDLPA
jgi:uncharacterized cupin superfamily protein